jgi:uncharacterized protein (UPF0548 family)
MVRVSELTYTPVGATRTGPLPAGFRHLRYRTFVGSGTDLYQRAGEAVMTFAMHRAAGAQVRTSATPAAAGVRLTIVIGPMRAPCEVVWTVADNRQTGWAYGTRPGHPASGEESFVVEHDDLDRVWFTVTSYSRPASRLMRLGGPVAVVFQQLYARLCGRALKRLCAASVP